MSYVLDEEEIEPGPYLHMANDLISIARVGDGNDTKITKNIEDRIMSLSQNGMIPAATYGVNYGWSSERGFSFGGFAYDPGEMGERLIAAMKTAQMDAFTATITNEVERLLGLLTDDLDAFKREFSGQDSHTGYYRTEILHLIDPDKFAEVVFGYVTSGHFEAIGSVLKSLADRLRNLDSDKNEGAWANSVKVALCKIAAVSGPLEKARMHWFLGFHWRFPIDADDAAID